MHALFIRSASLAAVLGFAAALAAAPKDKPAPSLKVGDPAPALAVGTWVKGEPVAALQKGTVYVVECWATWCGPCRATIPHLTELQKKHKEAVFIGVAVNDETGKVKEFVKTMGDKMDYRVGTDDKNKTSKNWLDAAGQDGIPCAFVVDKAGKLAWVGHPASKEFETAVEDALKAAGTGKAK
jgi:thiol-disulfide isomerase/thioredoxin